MRLLVVTNMWPAGDRYGGIFVKEQVQALRAENVVVAVEVVRQGRSRLDYVLGAMRVRRRAAAVGANVVHAHFGLTALSCLLLPRRIPLVITFHGSDVNRSLLRAVSRLVALRADWLVFVSGPLSERLKKPQGHRSIIPNGVDLSLFAPMPPEQARRALKCDRGAGPIVVFGSDPHRRVKRYDRFQAVLEGLSHLDIKDVVLHEPGDARERVALKLNAADCLLFTSEQGQEGSPMVVKEAVSVGLPVVSVDVGDVRTVVGQGQGVVVSWPEPHDERILVDRLRGALEAVLSQQIERLPVNADVFDGRAVARQLRQGYGRLLEASPTRVISEQ